MGSCYSTDIIAEDHIHTGKTVSNCGYDCLTGFTKVSHSFIISTSVYSKLLISLKTVGVVHDTNTMP